MTLAQAEKILGYDIDLNPVEAGYEASANWEHGTVTVNEKTREKACAMLVAVIYKERSKWVMHKQKYRCANCGELTALEIDHHPVPRSKGRDDRIQNLRAVCASFTGCRIHEKKHG